MGPAAKVGPCQFGVVNNGTGNISLLVLSDMPEGTDERYQNNSNAISKQCEIGKFILCTFLKIFALYVTCYKTANMRRPYMSLYHVRTVSY